MLDQSGRSEKGLLPSSIIVAFSLVFPPMHSIIAGAVIDVNHCRSCHRCQLAKAPTSGVQHPPGHLVAHTHLEIVTIDFTRLEMSRDGYEYVLVITDVFTKWVVAVPVKDQSAETVVRVPIDEWILNFGAPTQLHSDQGRNFESRPDYPLSPIWEWRLRAFQRDDASAAEDPD